MGVCCSKKSKSRSRSPTTDTKAPNSVTPKLSRHVTLRPDQPDAKSIDKRLLSIDPEDVVDVPHKGEHIRVRVTKVYDGDTLTFVLLHGGMFPLKLRMRIVGVDAPEIKGRGVSELHSEAGKAVQEVVEYLTKGKILWARIDKWDKYGGRVDGDIFLDLLESEDDPYAVPLSTWLLQCELVHAYSGTSARDAWMDEEFAKIIVQSQKLMHGWAEKDV